MWKLMENIIEKTDTDVRDAAKQAGAFGGKLLGSGAGGFMLFIVPEEKMKRVKDSMNNLITVPIKIDPFGAQVSQNRI